MKRSLNIDTNKANKVLRIVEPTSKLVSNVGGRSVLLDALLNFNPNLIMPYRERDINIRDIPLYQLKKIYYYFLQVLGVFSYDSWEHIIWRLIPDHGYSIRSMIFNYLLRINYKSKDTTANLWTLKLRWINLFRFEISAYDRILKNFIETDKLAVDEIIKHVEELNTMIIPFSGLHLVNLDWMLPNSRILSEFDDPDQWIFKFDPSKPLELGEIRNRCLHFLLKLYPSIKSIEEFHQNMIGITCRSLQTASNISIHKSARLENVEAVAIMFANYLRSNRLFDDIASYSPMQLCVSLFEYENNPVIIESACFATRNLTSIPNHPEFINEIKKNFQEKLLSFLSHESCTVALWAGRCLEKLAMNDTMNVKEIMSEIIKLFGNENENIAAWAIGFIGQLENKSIFCDVIYSESLINTYYYPNPVPVILSLLEKRDLLKPKIIKSCIWCLKNSALYRKFYDVAPPETMHPEIVEYIDNKLLLDPVFNPYAEKTVLFACQCIGALIDSSGPNKYPLNKQLFEKIACLANHSQCKNITRKWVTCYFGVLSCDKMVNVDIKKAILDHHLKSVVESLKSHDTGVVKAALWSICKIASSNIQTIPLINAALHEISPERDYIIKLLWSNDFTVIEQICSCCKVLFTEERLTVLITKILDIIETELNDNIYVSLAATNKLHSLISNGCENHEFNRKIVTEKGLVLLLKLLDHYEFIGIVCCCFANLSLIENNLKFINHFVVPRILISLENYNIQILEGALYLLGTAVIGPACFDVPVCLHLVPLNPQKCLKNISKIREEDTKSSCLSDPPICDIFINGCYDIVSFLLPFVERWRNNFCEKSHKLIYFCCWAIHKLALKKKHHNLLLKHHVFRIIILLLEYPNRNVHFAVCKCITIMIKLGNNATIAYNMNVFLKLSKFIDENDYRAVIAIECLTSASGCKFSDIPELANEHQISTDSLIKSEIGQMVIPKLIKFISDTPSILVENAVCCLASLSLIEKNQMLILHSSGLKLLIGLLNKKIAEKIIEGSIDCISHLLEQKIYTNITEMFDLDCIRKLMQLLEHRNINIVSKTCLFLSKLAANEKTRKFMLKHLEYFIALLVPLDTSVKLPNLLEKCHVICDLPNSPNYQQSGKITEQNSYFISLENKIMGHVLAKDKIMVIFKNSRELNKFIKNRSVETHNRNSYFLLTQAYMKKNDRLVEVAKAVKHASLPILTTRIVVKALIDLDDDNMTMFSWGFHFIQTFLPINDREDRMIRGVILQNNRRTHEFHLSLKKMAKILGYTPTDLTCRSLREDVEKKLLWTRESCCNLIFHVLCCIDSILTNNTLVCDIYGLLYPRLALYLDAILSNEVYLEILHCAACNSSSNLTNDLRIYEIVTVISRIAATFSSSVTNHPGCKFLNIFPSLLSLFIKPSCEHLMEQMIPNILTIMDNDTHLHYISNSFLNILDMSVDGKTNDNKFIHLSVIINKIAGSNSGFLYSLCKYAKTPLIQQIYKHRDNKYCHKLLEKIKSDLMIKNYLSNQALTTIQESHRYWLDLVLISNQDEERSTRQNILNSFCSLLVKPQYDSLSIEHKHLIIKGHLDAISATVAYPTHAILTDSLIFCADDICIIPNIVLPLFPNDFLDNISIIDGKYIDDSTIIFPITLEISCFGPSSFPTSYSKAMFPDISIVLDNDKSIKAHKAILYNSCNYFKVFFNDTLKSYRGSDTVTIKEVDYHVFLQVIIFMYEHKITFTSIDNVKMALRIADRFQIPLLQQLISEFICKSITPRTFLEYLDLSEQLLLDTLTTGILSWWCINWKFCSDSDKASYITEWPHLMKIIYHRIMNRPKVND